MSKEQPNFHEFPRFYNSHSKLLHKEHTLRGLVGINQNSEIDAGFKVSNSYHYKLQVCLHCF